MFGIRYLGRLFPIPNTSYPIPAALIEYLVFGHPAAPPEPVWITMPRLTLAEVEHVALLSRLRLTDEEKTKLTEELNVILDQFEILQRVNTEGVPPTAHAMVLQNVLREDAARPSLPRESFLTEAPEARDEFFVVPRVVDTGE